MDAQRSNTEKLMIESELEKLEKELKKLKQRPNTEEQVLEKNTTTDPDPKRKTQVICWG